jgi:hypothetical protein
MPADADEFLEVLGDELRAVVGDDARTLPGEFFAGALEDGFHVDFLHFLTDFPVNEVTAAAIEDRAQEVKRAGDVQVTDIDVPVFVGLQRLHEAGAFLGGLGRLAGQEPRVFEDAIDAGRAAGDDVGVEHHEGQVPITIKWMLPRERLDVFLLRIGEPMIAWDPGVVFIDFAEASFPIVELARADADPGEEATDSDLGLIAPRANEIDELITAVVGDPAALQISPSSFFKTVWASMSSAMTSFLRASLASSCSIFLRLASSRDLDLRPLSKARWAFSKS